MHPGLANLVGRILESELQTKIRGLSLFSQGLLLLGDRVKLGWYSFGLQETENQVIRENRDYSLFKKSIPKLVVADWKKKY